nr:MAG TPA: hypothetical protein [Caudoviricetes sp.]
MVRHRERNRFRKSLFLLDDDECKLFIINAIILAKRLACSELRSHFCSTIND